MCVCVCVYSCTYTFVRTILTIESEDIFVKDILTGPHFFKGLFEG